MRYCQGTMCHEYKTKDRIRGQKGDKHYETRKGILYHGEFCSTRWQDDWLTKFVARAIDHFGRTHEPKRTDCDNVWYKNRDWRNDRFYYVNDLLGERISITEEQYDNPNLVRP